VRIRKGAAAIGIVAAALLVAAGCSSSKTSGTPSTTTTAATGYNAAATGIVNPSTHKGGTLKLANSSDADSYDCSRTYYAWMWNFSRYYCRTLVTSAAAPGQASLKLVNDLASSQDISSDGLTYTYKLKSGIKFQDGSPITSADIKYGIERQFATDVINGGPTYLIGQLDPKGTYKGPYKDKAGLSTIDASDPTTIVFHLAKPFSDFPYLLAMPGASPVQAAKDTGAKYGLSPQSTGPYEFKSYQPGKSVVLVRNPNWDQSTDTVRKALPDEIDMALGIDANEIDNELMAGTINVDTGQVGVQPAAQAKILSDPTLKANADDPNTGFIRYIAISTVVAPFNNIACRQAVQYATDKTTFQAAGGGPSGGDIATSMLPPNIGGYDKSLAPYTGAAGKPDIAKAKAALATCGQPNGFKTTIATSSSGRGPALAQALQESLKAVGITAAIIQRDPATYYSTTIGSPSNVHSQKIGLMVAGWGADFPTGYGFLDVLVDGTKILPAGNSNYEELNDPAINTLIQQALNTPDATAAAAIWGQINSKVMDSASLMPILDLKALNYRSPSTTNVYIDSYYGMDDFQALGVSGS
jgi:peptide/nickel transport system substrate-binding protein